MSTFECTWVEFKSMAKEFNQAIPTLDIEQLDNAWKCLGLHYLGMKEEMWIPSAALLLEMMCKVYINRSYELTRKDNYE